MHSSKVVLIKIPAGIFMEIHTLIQTVHGNAKDLEEQPNFKIKGKRQWIRRYLTSKFAISL